MTIERQLSPQDNNPITIKITGLDKNNLNNCIRLLEVENDKIILELISVNLEQKDCIKLGSVLKNKDLHYLCLKNSALSVEESVTLIREIYGDQAAKQYCESSAKTYMDKYRSNATHEFAALYLAHSLKFSEHLDNNNRRALQNIANTSNQNRSIKKV